MATKIGQLEVWQNLQEREKALQLELAKIEERKRVIDEQIQCVKTELTQLGVKPEELDITIFNLEQQIELELSNYDKSLTEIEEKVKQVKITIV